MNCALEAIALGGGHAGKAIMIRLETAAAACGFCHSSAATLCIPGVADHFFGSASPETNFMKCAICGSLWQDSPPGADELAAAYEYYYTHGESGDNSFGDGIRAKLRKAYADAHYRAHPSLVVRATGSLLPLLSPHAIETDAAMRFVPKAPARILDYGSGSAVYLERLRTFGYDAIGVDFDPKAVAAARARGFECLTPDAISSADWTAMFDAITLNHVIEHVYHPADLLRQLSRWLRPGGRIFIETPNAAATGLNIFREFWRGLEAPRHLNIPTIMGLEAALHETGFRITRRMKRKGVRDWMWRDSLAAMPDQRRASAETAMAAAPAETLENAEFLTLTASQD